jgi:hypothetical protein
MGTAVVEFGGVNDERIVAAARDGIATRYASVDVADIERVVREELESWRSRSRVQTFVPVFAQRTARERIATGRLNRAGSPA